MQAAVKISNIHFLAPCFQALLEGHRTGALLKIGWAVTIDEMTKVKRILWQHSPIQNGNDGFGHIIDDTASPW